MREEVEEEAKLDEGREARDEDVVGARLSGESNERGAGSEAPPLIAERRPFPTGAYVGKPKGSSTRSDSDSVCCLPT